jgi:regulator of protease activity HflC (stomatin/prohibitin superfamily)
VVGSIPTNHFGDNKNRPYLSKASPRRLEPCQAARQPHSQTKPASRTDLPIFGAPTRVAGFSSEPQSPANTHRHARKDLERLETVARKVNIMIQNFPIQQNEKGILSRYGRFIRILEAGANTVYGRGYSAQTFKLESKLPAELAQFFLAQRPELVQKHFLEVQTSAFQMALVVRGDDVLDAVTPNSRVLYWKGFNTLRLEALNIQEGIGLDDGSVLGKAHNAALLRQFFVEVSPAMQQYAIVSRAGLVRDLVCHGQRRLYWRGLEDVNVASQVLAAPVAKNVAEAVLAAAPNWLSEFTQLELGANRIAILRRGAVIAAAYPPNSNVLLLLDRASRIEMLDTSNLDVPLALAKSAKGTPLEALIEYALVPEYHQGALFLDGKLERPLGVGVHAFWKVGYSVRVAATDLRLQTLEVSGQEILTKDKVALRLNLAAGYRVLEPLLAFAQLSDFVAFLYKELQFALRGVIGTRTLDALLEDKTALDGEIAALVRPKLEGLGIQLESVGVKDIILPGEMKTILAKVVEAEKQAQANLIRRREETAATRNLLNTAKVMEDNPVALRLKELEALERITEKVQSLTVTNGLDGVLNDLVRIRKN